MTFAPSSLLARTFLLLAALMIASLLAWSAIYAWFERGPRASQAAQIIISVINLTRTALVTAEPYRRRELLNELSRREGLRIYPAEETDHVEALAPTSLFKLIETELQQRLDTRTVLAQNVDGRRGLFVRFSISDDEGRDEYWLMIPRERIERSLAQEWTWWGIAALLLALGGAFLIVRRVTRPLKALTLAARAIGKGERPAPLSENGPEELATVAHAFNQMARDIAQIETDRALILAGISHDLRTPLTRLRLGVELADIDEPSREGMNADIEDIDKVIGQFLDFARETAGEPPAETDIPGLLAEVVGNYSRRGLPVQLRHCDPLPAMVVRPVAIRRSVKNLIDNALRYAGQTLPVEVNLLRVGRYVDIEVLDRGPGIPPDQVERLKRPFARLETARSDAGGAGLGLAIVDRVMRAHGGTLELALREGGGLVATLRLPLPRQNSKPSKLTARDETATTVTAPSGT